MSPLGSARRLVISPCGFTCPLSSTRERSYRLEFGPRQVATLRSRKDAALTMARHPKDVFCGCKGCECSMGDEAAFRLQTLRLGATMSYA